jgi:Putative zinc-finger
MNQIPQSDLHPSAEMLNAFTEQSLGTREREQMTAHLAGCGRCREVVFLAHEAALEEESFAGTTKPVRGESSGMSRGAGWFSGWNLIWAGGIAAACLVLGVVTLRLLRPAVAPQTATVVTPKTAPVMQAKEMPPQPPPSVPDVAAQSKPRPAPLRRREAKAAPSSVAMGYVLPLSVDADSNASAAVISRSQGENLALKSRGMQTFVPQRQVQQAAAAQQFEAGRASGEGIDKSIAGPMDQRAGQAGLVGGALAAQPAAASAPVAAAANETVAVSSAQMVTLDAASVSTNQSLTPETKAKKKAEPALPNGMAAISNVDLRGKLLAIDGVGNLFLSNDGGVAWQAVTSQWTGRAVSVRVKKVLGMKVGKFELVNDRGAVWNSVDGLVWKPK